MKLTLFALLCLLLVSCGSGTTLQGNGSDAGYGHVKVGAPF